jgi:2-polyprenyl-6-methoxyphenol hydroxylase-like FAD-dependent oxidoreductase
MKNRAVLISGAGVAGLTLAYWLSRFGFTPTVIERAPTLRTGGYIMDFWGAGFGVAEKMQLITRLRRAGYDIGELRIVDARGRRIGGFRTDRVSRILRHRYLSILRGDLVAQIYGAAGSRFDTIFGNAIRAIAEDEFGVAVEFDRGAPRRFDLVIGADGLHSQVRRLIFGQQPGSEAYLGYCAASFAAAGYPHRDEGAYVAYCEPGKQVARFALRDGRTVFFLIFAMPEKSTLDRHNSEGHKQILHDVFSAVGWECSEILAALDRSEAPYLDAVSQIHLDRWYCGRVALIGDAAFCPSLLVGEGSSLAMASAYVLAGELERADGDHRIAYPAYQDRLKAFVDRKQHLAAGFARQFAPQTRFGLVARNTLSRLLGLPVIGDLMAVRMFADRFALPEYG